MSLDLLPDFKQQMTVQMLSRQLSPLLQKRDLGAAGSELRGWDFLSSLRDRGAGTPDRSCGML